MNETIKKISELLHEATKLHSTVYKITGGDDPNWAMWYSDWLIRLSKLPKIIGIKPVESELIYMLVKLDKEYKSKNPQMKWEDYYAQELAAHFQMESSAYVDYGKL